MTEEQFKKMVEDMKKMSTNDLQLKLAIYTHITGCIVGELIERAQNSEKT